MTGYPEASSTITLARSRPLERHEFGPLGRLGRWTEGHVQAVALAWVAVAVLLGAFAPRAEKALSGAGWEVSGSESVQARALIQENFGGLSSQALTVVVHSERQTLGDAAASARWFAASSGRSTRTPRSLPRAAAPWRERFRRWPHRDRDGRGKG